MFRNCIMIIVSFAIVEAAKILMVFSIPSFSHQVVFRPLIQELINRDHEVTLITTDPMYQQGNSPKNLREIDLHNISYTIWNNRISKIANIFNTDNLSKMAVANHLVSVLFEQQLKDNSVQNLIKDKTVLFDLLVLEECVVPAFIFAHIFNAPVIQMSSFDATPGNMEITGAVSHPFVYPMQYMQRVYNLTTWEKMTNLYDLIMLKWIIKNQEHEDDKMFQRLFGYHTPPLSDLRNNVQMRFLNVHPIWTHNRPVPPNVVYTWGIHKYPEKPLPKDLQHYLDSSKNGAIYISFGTNFRTSAMPPATLKILLKVFSQLPYNILWKWDEEELHGKSENIKISKWFPQSDVLRHPNLKLVITHGGLQSTDEAINAAVPLIGIPIFSDQLYNTEKYVHFKIGIKLDFQTLTVEKFEDALKTMFREYDRYKENIIKLRVLMNDQPKPPLENVIWWFEHVIRHGGARHLRTPAANMSWAEYYELKLIIIIVSGLSVIVILLLMLMYLCCKYISKFFLQSNKTKVF